MNSHSKFALLVVASTLVVAVTSVDAYDTVEVSDAGSVVGVVRLTEKAPDVETLTVSRDFDVCAKEEKLAESLLVTEGGGIRNVVASLTGIEKGKAWSSSTPMLDQEGCRFEPHVLLVQAGESFDIGNNDDILHMIRAHSGANPAFNVGQPKFNKAFSKVLHNPEIIKVTCDVHDWMDAFLVVQAHPYYAISDADGLFTLDHVPPGTYELSLWHERLGLKTGTVTVDPNSETKVLIKLKLRSDTMQIAELERRKF